MCWSTYFYPKDPCRIKFSRFYLLWGVRYLHLCYFSHFQKCDNYVITPLNVRIFFQNSNSSEPGQIYPHMPKISPGGLPVSSINSVNINIYIFIYIYTSAHTLDRSLHDLFALGWHFMPRKC